MGVEVLGLMITHDIIKTTAAVWAPAHRVEEREVLSVNTQEGYELYLKNYPFKKYDLIVSRAWATTMTAEAIHIVMHVIQKLEHVKKGHWFTKDPRNLIVAPMSTICSPTKPSGPRHMEAASAYRKITDEEEQTLLNDHLRDHIKAFIAASETQSAASS